MVRVFAIIDAANRKPNLAIFGVDAFDVAHNPQAIAGLVDYLRNEDTRGRTLAVAAFMADKAIADMLGLLEGRFDYWYLGSLPLPRAMPAGELAQQLKVQLSVEAITADSATQALALARKGAQPGDRIVVFGSFVTVAETLGEHL